MGLSIPEETHERAVISAEGDRVVLSGEIDQIDPGVFLTPFFAKVNEQIGDFIKFDVSGLHYINSSGIKCIILFFMKRKPGVKIDIYYRGDQIWQRNSLSVVCNLDSKNIAMKKAE